MDDESYRTSTCPQNGVHLAPKSEKLLPHVQDILQVVESLRASPGPSIESLASSKQLDSLIGHKYETSIEAYFKELDAHKVFLPADIDGGILQLCCKVPMKKEDVPNDADMPERISTPCPDMLYGYQTAGAFTIKESVLLKKILMGHGGGKVDSLVLPFLLVEFKGGWGNMNTAANQCLGGSATCVRIAERLNDYLDAAKASGSNISAERIDTTVFSVAIDGLMAMFYATSKVGKNEYRMQYVSILVLQNPEDYVKMRRMIRNIIDWGREKRLASILRLLRALAAEPAPPRRQAAPSNGSSVVSSDSSN